MSQLSLDELTQVLAAGAAAHHDYEQVSLGGVRDQQWSGFYAAYTLGRLRDFLAPSTLSDWLEQAPPGDNWPATAADYVIERLSA